MTPQAAYRAAAQHALAQIAERTRAVLASQEPEHLHQLRVGMRRLRAALRAFRPILPRKEANRVRDALRELSPTLGRARDWDVLIQRLNAARAAPELIARAEAKRAKARQKALRGGFEILEGEDVAQHARHRTGLGALRADQYLVAGCDVRQLFGRGRHFLVKCRVGRALILCDVWAGIITRVRNMESSAGVYTDGIVTHPEREPT